MGTLFGRIIRNVLDMLDIWTEALCPSPHFQPISWCFCGGIGHVSSEFSDIMAVQHAAMYQHLKKFLCSIRP